MIQTAGTWDRSVRQRMFVASNVSQVVKATLNRGILIAVNNLRDEDNLLAMESIQGSGRDLLIDSGIFDLANSHAYRSGMDLADALSIPPESLDGFDALMERYLLVIDRLGAKSWGYVELDQGGRDHKCRIRGQLEAHGLRPIPVYHPLNDGWDYFDELASRYDRICLGNVVHADELSRLKLVRTVLARRAAKYPDLWIHGLGVGPSWWLNSLPLDSVDASTWLFPIRWGQMPVRACLTTAGYLDHRFFYRLDLKSVDPELAREVYWRFTRMLGFQIQVSELGWRDLIARLNEEFSCKAIVS